MKVVRRAGGRRPQTSKGGNRGGRAAGRVRRYGDSGADEERGRACWEAVDVLGEFVFVDWRRQNQYRERKSIDHAVVRDGATASLVIAGVESLRSRNATLQCHRKLI